MGECELEHGACGNQRLEGSRGQEVVGARWILIGGEVAGRYSGEGKHDMLHRVMGCDTR